MQMVVMDDVGVVAVVSNVKIVFCIYPTFDCPLYYQRQGTRAIKLSNNFKMLPPASDHPNLAGWSADSASKVFKT